MPRNTTQTRKTFYGIASFIGDAQDGCGRTLRESSEKRVHLELTTLIIPGVNDWEEVWRRLPDE
jgi:pyruvate-formate lyase-activating enzyme